MKNPENMPLENSGAKKIDTNNTDPAYWEKMLKSESLPSSSEIEKNVVERVALNEETKVYTKEKEDPGEFGLLAKAQEESLVEFDKLPSSIQENIITDLEGISQSGEGYAEILKRLSLLLTKSNEMLNMDDKLDDTNFTGHKLTPDQVRFIDEMHVADEYSRKVVEELLKKLKKIWERKKMEEGEESDEEENNDNAPKPEDEKPKWVS